MKAVRSILICFFSLFILSSCKKDHDVSIYGTWISQQVYNGYADGGDFKWTPIPDQYKYTLEFTADGIYNETTNFGSCTGTYSVTPHEILINTACSTAIYSINFERVGNVLILSYFVREGIIKELYIRTN